MLLARDEASPQTTRADTHSRSSPTFCFPPPGAGSTANTGALFAAITPGIEHFFAQAPDSFRIPSKSSLAIWKGQGLPSSTPCLSPSCQLPAPQEGADVGLEEVKSTSATFLWSLVIQKAGWGESTGKKEGGEKATRDILYNSKEQRSL